MNINNYLFLTPFFSFIAGYCIMQQFFYGPETITPHLIGKQVHEVLPLITQHKLNIRLINQKEEADLPEGIILNQTPSPGTAIKANQPLFLVTTKKPSTIRVPQCVGMHINEITTQLQTVGITPRVYYVSHPYPEKLCFAQSPQANESLEKNKLILYASSGNNKPIIWPDFSGLPVENVIEFLHNYNIEPHIIRNTTHTQQCKEHVIDQRPFAGTLLTLDENQPLSVQLRIQ